MSDLERLEEIEQEKELIADGITNEIVGVELTLKDYSFLQGKAQEGANLREEINELLEEVYNNEIDLNDFGERVMSLFNGN